MRLLKSGIRSSIIPVPKNLLDRSRAPGCNRATYDMTSHSATHGGRDKPAGNRQEPSEGGGRRICRRSDREADVISTTPSNRETVSYKQSSIYRKERNSPPEQPET